MLLWGLLKWISKVLDPRYKRQWLIICVLVFGQYKNTNHIFISIQSQKSFLVTSVKGCDMWKRVSCWTLVTIDSDLPTWDAVPAWSFPTWWWWWCCYVGDDDDNFQFVPAFCVIIKPISTHILTNFHTHSSRTSSTWCCDTFRFLVSDRLVLVEHWLSIT